MKVVKFLEWMLVQGISSENVGLVDVPRDIAAVVEKSEKFIQGFFCGDLVGELQSGKYAYIYQSNIEGSDIAELAKQGVLPDCLVFVNNVVVFMYLIEYNLEP